MRLHGNAALSWSGRRLLAERVLEQGWTLTATAAAAGVSRSTSTSRSTTAWLAYPEVLSDENTATAIGFFRRALTDHRRHGIEDPHR